MAKVLFSQLEAPKVRHDLFVNETTSCFLLFPGVQKPAKRLRKVKLAKDSRRTLTSIRRTIRKQRYRKDLKMVRTASFFDTTK